MIYFLRISPKHWLYFGVEDEVPRSQLLQRFWFIEEDQPYRIGNGWRYKARRDLAYHVGIAIRNPVSSDLEILGGSDLTVSPEEIGLWGAEDEEDHTREGPAEAGESQYTGSPEFH